MAAAVVDQAKEKDGNEKEFLQALEEVFSTLDPILKKRPKLEAVLERLAEPERAIIFRVPWIDDSNNIQVNRGFRVQFNSAIGPYKGGLRLHPTVNLSILKFLGFEQTFKNALTGLAMGGGKGGSDFDPKGKSDAEVMRFCQSFMTELVKHIGPNCDVPAGDIGVGGREIGFLFGQYKRLRNAFEGSLTGKGAQWGGSLLRPEATGYGGVYMLDKLVQAHGRSIKGLKVLVSGAGNVAQYTAEKLLELGAQVLSFSDSGGHVYCKDGFSADQVADLLQFKNTKRGRLADWQGGGSGTKFVAKQNPWRYPADVAMPSATQNEVDLDDVKRLVGENGVKIIVELANMPSTKAAVDYYRGKEAADAGLLVVPSKAANAGGVAVSGLEMAQNSQRETWSREQVDDRLKKIMGNIFDAMADAAKTYGSRETDYFLGANIAAFEKIAESMIAQGCV